MAYKLATCAAVAVFASMSTVASAATVICEDGGPGPVNPGICSAGILSDFSNDIGAPSPALTISGDTVIYGGVMGAWADAWTLDLGSTTYDLYLGIDAVDTDFTADVLVDGLIVANLSAVAGASSSVYLGAFSGTIDLALDALSGSAHWDASLSAVPLPGASVLLLGALGAMGVAGRRRAKA